jgi:hypothetical protein
MTSLPKGVELFLPDPPFDCTSKTFNWWEQGASVGLTLSHTTLAAPEVVQRLRELVNAIEDLIEPGVPLR